MTCPLCGTDGSEARCAQCGGNPSLAQLVKSNPSLAPGLRDVAERLRADEKIMAIKRLRELLPMGLKEAKDVVEGTHVGTASSSGAALSVGMNWGTTEEMRAGSVSAEVTGMIRAGKRIEAIKRVREIERVGLKQAREIVDAMEANLLNEKPQAPSTAKRIPISGQESGGQGRLVGYALSILKRATKAARNLGLTLLRAVCRPDFTLKKRNLPHALEDSIPGLTQITPPLPQAEAREALQSWKREHPDLAVRIDAGELQVVGTMSLMRPGGCRLSYHLSDQGPSPAGRKLP